MLDPTMKVPMAQALAKNLIPGAVTPRTFFEQICAALFRLRGDRPLADGAIAFELSGEDGGLWLLDFAEQCVTHEGNADLDIQMPVTDFSPLIAGTLDPHQAVSDGQLNYTGDAELFFALEALLTESTEGGRA